MKTIQQIAAQVPVFLHNWKNKFQLVADFEQIYMSESDFNAQENPWPNNLEHWQDMKGRMLKALKEYETKNILFASYGQDNYLGDAFVLFEEGGVLYEVNGSHCSCYGLEGQFSAEETSLEAIAHRLKEGHLGLCGYADNEFKKELEVFIGLN